MQHPAVSKESCYSNRDKVGDDLKQAKVHMQALYYI